MKDFVAITKTEGSAMARLQVVILAPPSVIAKLERAILFETSKENIPYVNQDLAEND